MCENRGLVIEFNIGQRVFDKFCGEYGTVIECVGDSEILIQYDQDFGCNTSVDLVSVQDLILAD